MQEGHGDIGADKRAGGSEQHIKPMVSVADDGKGREQIPNAAPRGGWQALSSHHGVGEHDIDRVGAGGGDKDGRCNQWVDLGQGHWFSPGLV